MFFPINFKKKLNRSHVENIDEMNYQGCGAQFLDELEGNNESLLKPSQFQVDMPLRCLTQVIYVSIIDKYDENVTNL